MPEHDGRIRHDGLLIVNFVIGHFHGRRLSEPLKGYAKLVSVQQRCPCRCCVIPFDNPALLTCRQIFSALTIKTTFNRGNFGSRAPQRSPRERPRAIAEITPETPPASAVIGTSSPVERARDSTRRSSLKQSKARPPASATWASPTAASHKPFGKDAYSRRSSESSSTSSADSSSKNNGGTHRHDRIPSGGSGGGRAQETAEVVRVVSKPSRVRSPVTAEVVRQATGSPCGELKMWPSRDVRRETPSRAARKDGGEQRSLAQTTDAGPALTTQEEKALSPRPRGGDGVHQGQGVVVLPLSKPIVATRQRGRQPPK